MRTIVRTSKIWGLNLEKETVRKIKIVVFLRFRNNQTSARVCNRESKKRTLIPQWQIKTMFVSLFVVYFVFDKQGQRVYQH